MFADCWPMLADVVPILADVGQLRLKSAKCRPNMATIRPKSAEVCKMSSKLANNWPTPAKIGEQMANFGGSPADVATFPQVLDDCGACWDRWGVTFRGGGQVSATFASLDFICHNRPLQRVEHLNGYASVAIIKMCADVSACHRARARALRSKCCAGVVARRAEAPGRGVGRGTYAGRGRRRRPAGGEVG